MKKVAILQSNYIPWKGYFDIIRAVDEFIVLDEVQYTRRDWRNRNKIKTQQGAQWLSVPVEVKGKYHQSIAETKIQLGNWQKKHWQSIMHAYQKAPFFHLYQDYFASIYLEQSFTYLSELNLSLIYTINEILGINTVIRFSTDYRSENEKAQRILSLCQQADAQLYLSGPSARSYLSETEFKQAKIQLCWAEYSAYPEYPQLYPPFEHAVSILDLIFNTGEAALQYMKPLLQDI